MRRREFITLLGGAAAAWPVAELGQQSAKLPTVGLFGPDAPERLGLLRELLPGVARIAVLVDPKWPLTERFISLSELQAAALAVGQQIEVLYVSSDGEIETAFTTLVQHEASP